MKHTMMTVPFADATIAANNIARGRDQDLLLGLRTKMRVIERAILTALSDTGVVLIDIPSMRIIESITTTEPITTSAKAIATVSGRKQQLNAAYFSGEVAQSCLVAQPEYHWRTVDSIFISGD